MLLLIYGAVTSVVGVFVAVVVSFPREVGVRLELGQERQHHLEAELVLLLLHTTKHYVRTETQHALKVKVKLVPGSARLEVGGSEAA